MASIEDKLKTVDSKFNRGSKSYKAARYIIRQNRELPKDEEEALINELEINPNTLKYVLNKLRKLGLYRFDIELEAYEADIPREDIEEDEEVYEEDQLVEEEFSKITQNNEYATIADLNSFRNDVQSAIDRLTSAIVGEEETEEGEGYIDEESIDILRPNLMMIGDPSLTRKSIWLKPKTQMYYDLTRQGLFSNYFGSEEISILNGFEGNLSDFFNSIIDDYFFRNFGANIGIMGR